MGFDKAEFAVYIGSDHAGHEAKDKLRDYLKGQGYEVIDLGTFTDEPYDYPDIAREVGEKVFETVGSLGILLCGSGAGVCMAANKLKGIRCGVATNEEVAETIRRHNNANVLALGARMTVQKEMEGIAMKFLTTSFEENEERHVRRVQKMNELDSSVSSE